MRAHLCARVDHALDLRQRRAKHRFGARICRFGLPVEADTLNAEADDDRD